MSSKPVLMVAFHYPPASGTSGVQRALRFSAHLPGFSWRPIVLTAHARAYDSTSHDLASDIPAEATVIRAQAWDAKRHFSLAGRYPDFLALPDRWSSWAIGGVVAGLRAIRKHKPAAIWSTYPIATAHRIAAILASRTGLPLIADFRDPMAQDGYPADPRVWQSFASVERKVVEAASICTFTTPGATKMYRDRYPTLSDNMRLLENGYDESVFAQSEKTLVAGPLNENKLTLVHSGIVYPSERDPTYLFVALQRLKAENPQLFSRLCIRFRAPVHKELVASLADEYGVTESLQIAPAVPYADAIGEMRRADGLLILQADNCNNQIPAKYYEYLRAGKPMLVVTDPSGDTATAAQQAGISAIAEFKSPDSIMSMLRSFLAGKIGMITPRSEAVAEASRLSRTESLAVLLNEVVSR